MNSEWTVEHDYSEKEMRMLAHFGFEDIAPHIAPYAMYRMMAEKAFVEDDRSVYGEALRCCLKVFAKGGYRGTPEFEALMPNDA